METDAVSGDSTHWHTRGVFRAADGREFKTGALGASTYLLSETGEKLTDGFHALRPVQDFEFNGKTYILGGAGALEDILEVDADGTITNISDLIEGPDDPNERKRWDESDNPPGRFHEIFVRDGKFVGTLGAGEWIITPGTWEVRPSEDELQAFEPVSEHSTSGVSRLWLVVVIVSILAVLYMFNQ